MKEKKLVVLDYSNSSVHFYTVKADTKIDEEYISNLGHHPSNSEWMCSNEVSIVYHEGVGFRHSD